MEQGFFFSNFAKIIFMSKKTAFKGCDNQYNRVIKSMGFRVTAQELVTLSVDGESTVSTS